MIELLGVDDRRWPDPVEGPWALRLVFGVLDGRPSVMAVQLYAIDPDEIKRAARRAGATEALASNPWDIEWAALPPMPAPQAITTSGVRLPLAKLTADYLASMGPVVEEQMTDGSTEWRVAAERMHGLLDHVADQTKPRRGPGRPPIYGREHFEKVAGVYLEALRVGEAPTEKVAGVYKVNKSTASKWVTKARDEYGLLPRTVKGKAAGWPITPNRGSGKGKR